MSRLQRVGLTNEGDMSGSSLGLAALVVALVASIGADAAERVKRDLQALYHFDQQDGDVVRDVGGVGQPLDLTIAEPQRASWRKGCLDLRSGTRISSRAPARKIIDAARRSDSLSVEAWIRPRDDDQDGPARIVSLSGSSTERNVTLGQDGDRYDARLRTTTTNSNGLPSLASPGGSLQVGLTHVVYTRNRSGNARLYLNARLVVTRKVGGKLSSWDEDFRLHLGDEKTGGRSWLGELHLVAIYSRALSRKEVTRNFEAGSPSGVAPAELAEIEPVGVGRAGTGDRVERGLRALYTFEAGRGETVHDRSGVGTPLDLAIDRTAAVRWRERSLLVRSEVLISSLLPPRKIYRAIERSGALSIEAWIRSKSDQQKGPARIVSLSASASLRNVTLGQDGARLDARLRTTRTSENGTPSLSTPMGSLGATLTHCVYTRDRTGRTRIFLDGEERAARKVGGDLGNWVDSFRLALVNERTGSRGWLGELHLVAIYSRALDAEEVARNFSAGSEISAPISMARERDAPASPEPKVATRPDTPRHFDSRIAPLLERHCLECHGAAKRKGRLDLSSEKTALAGGRKGKAIVPGDVAASMLWMSVESDEMPKKRPPLSAPDKALLRQWIEAGAVWSENRVLSLVRGDEPIDVHREFDCPGGKPSPGPILSRRLTVPEYVETVRAAVGVDIEKEAREILPPDLRADGFSNTAYNLIVDLGHVEAYAKLAELIVGRVDLQALALKHARCRALTEGCMSEVIASIGKWLLRGPLEEDEVEALLRVSTAVADEGGDFDEALGFTVEAMLQSPRFTYHIEDTRGDGRPRPVSDHELASRMSYILWGGPPDAELVRAADAGELRDRDGSAAQVRRMLDDPRAVEMSLRFVDDWLHLGRLDFLRPGPERFPGWDARLAADMRAETLAFFEDVVWRERRPLGDLLNAQFTYATSRLAEHYGLPTTGEPQLPTKLDGLRRHDLSGLPSRGGLLTQGSVLTIGGDGASMVARGLFILHDVLGSHVEDPPPGVDTTPVPTRPGLSQRKISERRIADEACGGCHSRFEPLSFGLERFDGVGAYKEKDEHGTGLRDDGKIVFPGEEEPVAYGSAAELMDLLARSARFRECITLKVTQFALGRPLVQSDVCGLDRIHEAAQNGGGTYADLITAIVLSDLVRMTRTENDR